RLVVMELARPASVSGVLAPAALLHGVRGRGPSRALVEVREGLVEAGCDGVEEQTAGSGVAVTIGHVPAP
ncbi:MAG: hypothetical protein OEZ37_07670, partial [Gemmatimonadota bacterium]|nr:hypothetical protein [Gemmatimonadota bacterium]